MCDHHVMDERQTLSDYAAGEVRAVLARRRITGRDLAAKLHVSRSWVSYRLTGTTEIGLNDLERIARALDVEVAALLPTPALRDERGHAGRASDSNANRHTADAVTQPRSAHLVTRGTHPDRTAHPDSGSPVTNRTRTDRPAIRPWRHEGVTAP